MTDDIKHIPAKHQGASRDPKSIRLLVIHTMEAPEKGTTAEAVAAYFQRGDRVASAHMCVDSDSMVECVVPAKVAYAAPGGNATGYHYELAGYARQSENEWADPYSVATLFRAAEHMARMARLLDIPIVFRDADDLVLGKSGITTHAQISKAFKKSTHTDPGAGFPINSFVQLVASFAQKWQGGPEHHDPPPLQVSIPAKYRRQLVGPGATGHFVRILQTELKAITGAPLAVDGVFGEATAQVVANFQRFFGLTQDPGGVAGRQTWFMLDCLVASRGMVPLPS